ncbi:MAG: 2-keto-4-pentenoate hydratase [Parasphingorhabdus sp.]
MMMNSEQLADVAKQFHDARYEGSRLDLITKAHPELSMEDAYEIARKTAMLTGSSITGYKLGFTSAAMRQQMNISAPNYGRLTADLHESELSEGKLVHPRIEPEITLLIGSDISEMPGTIEACWDHIEAVMPSLEIVDTRFHRYDFTLVDNTADNSSAAGYVMGAHHKPDAIMNQQVRVRLSGGDTKPLFGSSEDALGGPVEAFYWLCQKLIPLGETISAGSLIMTGGLTAAPFLKNRTKFLAEFENLGSAKFTWET